MSTMIQKFQTRGKIVLLVMWHYGCLSSSSPLTGNHYRGIVATDERDSVSNELLCGMNGGARIRVNKTTLPIEVVCVKRTGC